MIKQHHVLRFNNLAKFNNIVHGFSTNFFGSLRPSDSKYQQSFNKFTDAFGVKIQQVVKMNQIHSNLVQIVTKKDYGQIISDTDGLITVEPEVFLAVITGDCIPLFFYDQKKEIIAAVHAGWRGLFSEIIKETILKIEQLGGDPKDIFVGIGPSIRVCCYAVSEEFVENFRKKFKNVEEFLVRRNGKIYFDLQKVAKEQLVAVGIPEGSIEDADYCTFDAKDLYSYRREGDTFGEIMGIIGFGGR